MPEISRFLGIVIGIFPREHPPAHFHAVHGEYGIAVDIEGGVVHGDFPKRALRLVPEWLDLHREELLGVFRSDRVATTLATLAASAISDRGAVVFARLGDFYPGYWTSYGIHVPSSLMLAMVYAYHGDRERALEIARRTMHAVEVENGCSWDSLLFLRGDTGERICGNDYYQNLMLWALPAALAGEDLASPCAPRGLVDRILAAGRGPTAAGRTP